MKKKVINSPIRWAGSKKKLLNELLEGTFVKNCDNYIECFLGSGVVMLNVLNNIEELGYKKIYVNDINANIINYYTLLQKEPDYLIKKIQVLFEKYNMLDISEQSKMYYDIRQKFNETNNSKEKSIYFYFLMKTGFNGVYRENSKGYFNVPFGKKNKIVVDEQYFLCISELIQKVEFFNLPFEEFLNMMNQRKILDNSFVYCDPPYLPDDLLVYKKQMLYTKESFNHEKFFKLINELNIKNVMISMSDSMAANNVYYHNPFERKYIRDMLRVINPKKKFSSKEIAYINYTLKE